MCLWRHTLQANGHLNERSLDNRQREGLSRCATSFTCTSRRKSHRLRHRGRGMVHRVGSGVSSGTLRGVDKGLSEVDQRKGCCISKGTREDGTCGLVQQFACEDRRSQRIKEISEEEKSSRTSSNKREFLLIEVFKTGKRAIHLQIQIHIHRIGMGSPICETNTKFTNIGNIPLNSD